MSIKKVNHKQRTYQFDELSRSAANSGTHAHRSVNNFSVLTHPSLPLLSHSLQLTGRLDLFHSTVRIVTARKVVSARLCVPENECQI